MVIIRSTQLRCRLSTIPPITKQATQKNQNKNIKSQSNANSNVLLHISFTFAYSVIKYFNWQGPLSMHTSGDKRIVLLIRSDDSIKCSLKRRDPSIYWLALFTSLKLRNMDFVYFKACFYKHFNYMHLLVIFWYISNF